MTAPQESRMTTLQEAAQYRSLYELTGDIKDFNTMLVPRTALAQQREQHPVCHGCGIPAGDVHMSTCKSGKWPSRVSNGDTAAPAPQAQGEIDALRQALVYVAHAGHITPRHMLPKGVMLCDGDGVVVRVPNGTEVWGGNVSDYEKRRLTDNTHPQPTAPAPQAQDALAANFIVSAVVIKDTSTGFNTQHKLYPVSAANSDEATGKALSLVTNDFPEHRLHTMCFIQTAPAPQAQDALQDIAAYIGVGGYNGATTEQLSERIRVEFDRLAALQSAQPVGINGMVEAATRPAIDDTNKQGGQHE